MNISSNAFLPLARHTKAAEPAARPGWSLDIENDWRNDGAIIGRDGSVLDSFTPLDQVPAFQPANGVEPRGRLVMVNGIMTDVPLQTVDLQALADQGYQVVGVHNATKGIVRDLAQCLGDKLGLEAANNGAVDTTARLISDAVKAKQPLSLVGHSQGALIVSCALSKVEDELGEQGKSADDIAQALSGVTVTSLGGAASFYPEGPTYHHLYNIADVVPMLAGRPLGSLLSSRSHETFQSFGAVNTPENLPPLSNGVGNVIARAVEQSTHGTREVYYPELQENGIIAR